ncbi:hypothetical protein ACFO5K_27010 [Nocardia halotolerans]|uniref:Uncharacterized protein n=1 Tax=Nocardia halotolerans TaxID=1755878 RepID=A0ABV8VST7_9NOCA
MSRIDLCGGDGLVTTAKNNGADTEVVNTREDGPDRTSAGPNAVGQAIS